MKFYDAHTHLNSEDMYPNYQEYMQKFVDVGGLGLVNIGASDFYNEKGLDIAKSINTDGLIVKATLGFHPDTIDKEINQENIKSKIKNLKSMIDNSRDYVVAVGECGIDLHFTNEKENLALQTKLFIAQCELARELQLPLVVHSRDAFDQTLDVLKDYQNLVIYFHCRGYGAEEVATLKNAKFKKLFIGFCGNVTYKSADILRESLKLVPLDTLLLETDAPYLAPQVVRGQTNEPANVSYIYEFVAEYLNVSMEKLTIQIEQNFKNLYGL